MKATVAEEAEEKEASGISERKADDEIPEKEMEQSAPSQEQERVSGPVGRFSQASGNMVRGGEFAKELQNKIDEQK